MCVGLHMASMPLHREQEVRQQGIAKCPCVQLPMSVSGHVCSVCVCKVLWCCHPHVQAPQPTHTVLARCALGVLGLQAVGAELWPSQLHAEGTHAGTWAVIFSSLLK